MWKNGRYMFYCLDILIKKKKKKENRIKGSKCTFFWVVAGWNKSKGKCIQIKEINNYIIHLLNIIFKKY